MSTAPQIESVQAIAAMAQSYRVPMLTALLVPLLYALHTYGGVSLELVLALGIAAGLLGLRVVRVNTEAARQAWRGMTGQLDPSTGLYNTEALTRFASAVLRSTQPDHKPVSVVVFDFPDLLEVHSIYGRGVSRKVIAHVAGKLRALAGGRGMAARTGKVQFTVVLPGMGREKARQAVERALGKSGCIEFDAGDEEIVLVPDFAIETAPAHSESIQDIHRELCQELAQERLAEQRRHHYMQRERERHSRPMGLQPALVPATMPVSLASR
ncbi:MAG TPA: GGDEF domain-containing protein [Ramlibacter sp.]|nr:GGDEF domain-containing protein [Ramlibacter sp.]